MMTTVRSVKWEPSWRVIPTRYTEDRILRKVAEPKDFEITSSLEQMTSDRRRHLDEEVAFVLPEDRVTGPGSDYLMAPFTYRNPNGSRFSDGSHGVYYTARAQTTAVEETKHHRAVFMNHTKQGPMRLEMRVLNADLEGELHDVRGLQKKHPAIYHRSNYSASQVLGRQLVAERSYGIAYDSIRHKGGECAAIFRPSVLRHCRPVGLLAFDWNGAEISKVYELREYK